MLENIQSTANMGRIVSPAEGMLGEGGENGDSAVLQKELEQALAPEIFRKDVALRHEANGLVISLREVGFFPSGSSELRSTAIPTLRRIAQVLLERSYELRIEGHTDNIRIHNAQFASNWELSTARAMEVIRLLISDMGFAPERLSVGGYGEFHPITTNTTEEGRALNRRVDIVILRRSIHPVTSPNANNVPNPTIRSGLAKIVPLAASAVPSLLDTNAKPSPSHTQK
jgi:chemotaxis protein MotB